MSSISRLGNDASLSDSLEYLRALQNTFKGALKQSKNNQIGSLVSHLQTSSTLDIQTSSKSSLNSQTQRNVSRNGDTQSIQTSYTRQGTVAASSSQSLSAISDKQVQGTSNGKPIFLHEERRLSQLSSAARNTAFSEQRHDLLGITRSTEKQGAGIRTVTHIDSASDGRLNVETQAARRTETNLQTTRFDRAGNVSGSTSSRQAITAYQSAAALQNRHAEGTRDITQTTTRSAGKDGNARVQEVRTETSDVSRGTVALDTAAQSRTTTRVEKLDADGNVLAARSQAQQIDSREARTIDTDRQVNAVQTTQNRNGPDGTESRVHGRLEAHANIVDQTRTVGTIQTFDGKDNQIGERNFERNVTAVTNENQKGERDLRTTQARVEGVVRTSTELKAEEETSRTTQITTESNGAVSESFRDVETKVRTRGELTSAVGPNGDRSLEFDIEQTRLGRSRATVEGANGQGREVATQSTAALAVQGSLQFNAATGEVGAVKKAEPGAVNIQIGTFSGIRSSFQLNNGELTFDFTVQSAAASVTTTGPVPDGENGADASRTQQQTAAAASVHFQGKVVSTVDEDGNRVVTLSAKAVGEAAAARAASGQGQAAVQVEQTRTELEINGTLAVGRTAATNGGETTVETQARADLQVNRVTEGNIAGVNARSLTSLTPAEGIRAGFSATTGGLSFNFGAVSFGINFVA